MHRAQTFFVDKREKGKKPNMQTMQRRRERKQDKGPAEHMLSPPVQDVSSDETKQR